MMSHLKRLLGYPRVEPVTHQDVEPAQPPNTQLEEEAREATVEFVYSKWEVDRSSREVRRQIASGALRLKQGH